MTACSDDLNIDAANNTSNEEVVDKSSSIPRLHLLIHSIVFYPMSYTLRVLVVQNRKSERTSTEGRKGRGYKKPGR